MASVDSCQVTQSDLQIAGCMMDNSWELWDDLGSGKGKDRHGHGIGDSAEQNLAKIKQGIHA